VLGTLSYKVVKFERGENLSHKTQVCRFLFSGYFLFAMIQFSNLGTNSIGAAFPPPPTPSYAYAHWSVGQARKETPYTIKNKTHNVQPIKIHENKTKKKSLRSEPSRFAYLPSRCIDADFNMKHMLPTTCPPASNCIPLTLLQHLKICKNYSVTPSVPEAMDSVKRYGGVRQVSPLSLCYTV
jgi:hypothetical protein